MKSYTKTIIALAATAAFLTACGKKDSETTPETQVSTANNASLVYIGSVEALTGPSAVIGQDSENGVKMAIKELNQEGIKIDGKTVTFKLIAEDDAGDPRQATIAAQKLVDANVAGVIGHLTSGTTLPASQIYAKAGIPQVSPSASNPTLTEQGLKTVFSVVADDERVGAALGAYVVDALHAKTFAVIDDRTAYGEGLAKEFSKAVQAQGGKIIAKEFTNDHATDFTSILTTIKAQKPDVIFFGGMDSVGGIMMNQMLSLDIKTPLVGGDGLCSTQMLKLSKPALTAGISLFCAEPGGVDTANSKSYQDFRAKYTAEFKQPIQIHAPAAYDATMILVKAMEKADSTNPEKYLPVLAATKDYPGVSGSITFDAKGAVVNGAVTIKKATQQAKFEMVQIMH